MADVDLQFVGTQEMIDEIRRRSKVFFLTMRPITGKTVRLYLMIWMANNPAS